MRRRASSTCCCLSASWRSYGRPCQGAPGQGSPSWTQTSGARSAPWAEQLDGTGLGEAASSSLVTSARTRSPGRPPATKTTKPSRLASPARRRRGRRSRARAAPRAAGGDRRRAAASGVSASIFPIVASRANQTSTPSPPAPRRFSPTSTASTTSTSRARSPDYEVEAVYERHGGLFDRGGGGRASRGRRGGRRGGAAARRLPARARRRRLHGPRDCAPRRRRSPSARRAWSLRSTVSRSPTGRRPSCRRTRRIRSGGGGSRQRGWHCSTTELNAARARGLERSHAADRGARMAQLRARRTRSFAGSTWRRCAEQTRGVPGRDRAVYQEIVAPELRAVLGFGLADTRPRRPSAICSARPALDEAFDGERLIAGVHRDDERARASTSGASPNIILDTEQRPTKTPRAYCAPVRVPRRGVPGRAAGRRARGLRGALSRRRATPSTTGTWTPACRSSTATSATTRSRSRSPSCSSTSPRIRCGCARCSGADPEPMPRHVRAVPALLPAPLRGEARLRAGAAWPRVPTSTRCPPATRSELGVGDRGRVDAGDLARRRRRGLLRRVLPAGLGAGGALAGGRCASASASAGSASRRRASGSAGSGATGSGCAPTSSSPRRLGEELRFDALAATSPPLRPISRASSRPR